MPELDALFPLLEVTSASAWVVTSLMCLYVDQVADGWTGKSPPHPPVPPPSHYPSPGAPSPAQLGEGCSTSEQSPRHLRWNKQPDLTPGCGATLGGSG